jgi:DNA repair photolyase
MRDETADGPIPDETIPDRAIKGRGAVSNRVGRFEAHARVKIDDGWGDPDEDDLPPLRTVMGVDAARSILSRNQSPDIPFDASINPYRGCEHGCVYCYARPTHAYLGLSPGLDFETRLFHKPDAAQLLDKELRAPGYRPQLIALGANTDPYQPAERELGLSRRILQVLAAFNNPVMITTKSALVLRDLDILSDMATRGLAVAGISLTTLDRDLARKMEPRAMTPARRLDAIRRLSDAGVPVAVLASPMIPSLNDHELEGLVTAGADMGAVAASTTFLRLPREIADLFAEWAQAHVPDRAGRILSLVRQSRGGELYDSRFETRMQGTGPYAGLLRRRLALVSARLGLQIGPPKVNVSLFRPPPRPGDQLSLFGG